MYIVCIILVSLSVLKLSSGNPSEWGQFKSDNEVPEHRLYAVEESAEILKEQIKIVQKDVKAIKEALKLAGILFQLLKYTTNEQ